MNNKEPLIPILMIVSVSMLMVVGLQTAAYSTGGAGEIKGLIDPIIDRAITALEKGNTELALEEIQTLKNELEDTFSAEDEDDKD